MALVALGSNLGDRLANLQAAHDLIASLPGTLSLEASPVYETEPVGVSDAHRSLIYLNAVLAVRTTLDVETWSLRLHAIEDALHRVRTGERNAPRPIDVDLITYGDVRMSRPDLTLPHPRAALRRFVLQPLADLRPDIILPGESRTVSALLASLPSSPWVRATSFTTLREGGAPKGQGEPAKTSATSATLATPATPSPPLREGGAPKGRGEPAETSATSATSATLATPATPSTPLREGGAPKGRGEPAETSATSATSATPATSTDLTLRHTVVHGDLSFHGVRRLRLSHLRIEGTLRLSRIDGFSLRHIHAREVILAGCVRHGTLDDIFAPVSLRADDEPPCSGPIDHIALRRIHGHLSFHRTRSTIDAIGRGRTVPRTDQPGTRLFRPSGPLLVTSPFGLRTHPVTGEPATFHSGVDCVLLRGKKLLETGICAYADGTVLEAEDSDGPAGTHVAIDHGHGLVTRYFHLEIGSLRVAPGDRIHRGTLFGWMGKTGRSTGEHLHFQVEQDGVPCDPTTFVRL